MEKLICQVPEEWSGRELRGILREQGISTSLLRRLKQTDGILLNGEPVTVLQRVKAGQTLTLLLPETPSPYIQPVKMDLTIVYEDDWVMVVDKPAGMPVHPSAGHREDTLANGVAYYMKEKSFTFRPVTRLDRYTSGLTLIAKNPVAAARLCNGIGKGEIQKTYYAVTDGIPDPEKGTIRLPIARQPGSVLKRQVDSLGKPALTRYETVEVRQQRGLVRVQPVTGRTHQIRVHLAALGCPLVYDFLYGREVPEKSFLLRCTGLSFPHPEKNQTITVEIPHNFNDW